MCVAPKTCSLLRSSLGVLGTLFPLSLCVWDKQEPLWSWGKEKEQGSAAVGCSHILLP